MSDDFLKARTKKNNTTIEHERQRFIDMNKKVKPENRNFAKNKNLASKAATEKWIKYRAKKLESEASEEQPQLQTVVSQVNVVPKIESSSKKSMASKDRLASNENIVDINPSDNLFRELGKNNYDFKDLLSELIDNSIAARLPNESLEVVVEVYVHDGHPVRFIIRDNASGIAHSVLGDALSPGALQTRNSLNEHGMGMKQAIAAIGELEYLATKVEGENSARVIKQLKFGRIPVTRNSDFPHDHGTEISITNLNRPSLYEKGNITRNVKDWLGARYRYYLKPEAKVLNLEIRIKDKNGRDTSVWQIEDVKPVYLHTGSRHNEPVIIGHKLGNRNWSAELTFGYAPSSGKEYEELGLEEPNRFHPYYVSLGKQGLDILLHDRVIKFHQFSELNIVSSRHPDYNTIRGEISLKSGFHTAITKNSIADDENFQELVVEIRNLLTGKSAGPRGIKRNYLRAPSYPDQIPEKLLRDRLAVWLKTNALSPRKSVHKEFALEGIDGYADILADNEVWELKVDQADARDVYQLFMYMDIGEKTKGFLVAKTFTGGARIAAEKVKEKHAKTIVLTEIDSLPINHHPTEQERQTYY